MSDRALQGVVFVYGISLPTRSERAPVTQQCAWVNGMYLHVALYITACDTEGVGEDPMQIIGS